MTLCFSSHPGSHKSRIASPNASRYPVLTGQRAVLSTFSPRFKELKREEIPTFANQASIPRLPIPRLEDTAKRYLRSLEPLLGPEEFKRSQSAVEAFIAPGGLGEKLQERLFKLDEKAPHSWLEDIWLSKAYLEWREPSYINVNWWTRLRDPPYGLSLPPPKHVTVYQRRRAARLIASLLDTNDRINTQQLPPEDIRGQPLCMDQYRKQLGGSRIAQPGADTLYNPYPTTSRHIVVMCEDTAFEVPVYSEKGERLSTESIERQLDQVVKMTEKETSSDLKTPFPGILTTENRDVWAEAREKLHSLSHTNQNSLTAIDQALFAVCLDKEGADMSTTEFAAQLFHANGGRNRWYDKTLQLILAPDGKAGVNGEHSAADAVIPGNFFNWMIQEEMEAYFFKKNPSSSSSSSSSPFPPPKALNWDLDDSLRHTIQNARENAKNFSSQIQCRLLHHHEFGASSLKQLKVSPDAFMQMALQLAYFRLHGSPCPTYESASSRAFLNGRTETVRSCSVESLAFTRAFEDARVPDAEKAQALASALTAHLEYMKAASMGKGVDRHLLGLRCQIQGPEEAEEAGIFMDPAFAYSQSFQLSSSNMSPGDAFYGGFAPVVKEGYGVNYSIGQEGIKASVSTWETITVSPSGGKISRGDAMVQAISRSLNDMHNLLLQEKAKKE
ncbi:MAG: acyltransferase ChoActase/COT/CPT [Piptocephalis tieghemiana]|nr:MAG: acyltransferase ChoActase/COT/CPT [Piptocephalis tieghemiana]